MDLYNVTGIGGLLLLVLDLWALISVLGSGNSTGNKLLWVLLILFLPLLGFILWLLAGPRSRGRAV
ncbi:PLDc N-terminal domain-containing protein [Rhodobacter maris]|uniref:Phospholipase D-like protein n=1 Tax=Rhodobacter maris TaxID=446682 RepID=A0A285TA58_9RHOB|nr:PLDc N-terminal domain-containing protein [Rhodobacter maris]SOC18449.1 phospholipase D-like protein [Rhodobacter maris]